jgi:outer membrane receptor protein involved in Fe transport
MKILRVITPTRYFEADLSYFKAGWDSGKFPQSPESKGRLFHGRLYYDPQAGYVPVELGVDDNVSGYKMYGGASSEDNSYSNRYNARLSMVDQFHPSHELKTGFEFKYSHLFEDRVHLHDDDPAKKFLWTYDVSPVELSAYIQDKIEFWGMIANVGLRWDYYSANKKLPDVHRTLEFPTNEAIFDSLQIGAVPLRKPSAKQHISPRVGFSFPITINSKVYFNYGHFVQMPATEALYSTTSDFGMPRVQWLGNPYLTFQKSINFELGYDQNVYNWLQLHVGVFYKDYSDVESGIVYAHSDQSLVLESAVQREYREIRGLDVEIRKSTGRFLTGFFNLNITQKSLSDLEVPNISQIPIITDNPTIGTNGELKGVPRPLVEEITPYGRGIITLSAPENWGPRLMDYPILAKTRASLGIFYRGKELTEHPSRDFREKHPDVKFYKIPYYHTNLRLSRKFDVMFNLESELYVDISNLWVSKYRSAIPNRSDYYDDLYANGKTDRVGSEEVSNKNILRTSSDVLYSGQHRTVIFGLRINL